MKEIDGERTVFEVVAENVGVVAQLCRRDALLLLELMHGRELVPQARGGFELLSFGSGHHARSQRALQLRVAAFKKQLCIADGVLVGLGRGEAFNARAEAAVNIVLQAGARMVAREIDLATGQKKTAVNELDYAISQIAGEVRPIISRAVFAQAARHENLGEAVGQGELDVGVGLVVAQQNVEARLALLDEIVFERECFVLVGDEDGLNIDGLAHQRAGFCVGLRGFQQIGAHARAQVVGLAHIDDLALGVLVEIHAGLRGQTADFFVEVHGRIRCA
jgi:hypothetical protein